MNEGGAGPGGNGARNAFVVRAEVILRHGPVLPDGVDTFTLQDTPQQRVTYERHGKEVSDVRRVRGAAGGWSERFTPAGVVKIVSRLNWILPAEADVNVQHRVVQLADDTRALYESMVDRTVRTAMAAFEMCTDSHVQVWGVAKSAGSWIDGAGNEYSVAYGSVEIEEHPVSLICDDDRSRFDAIFTAIERPENAPLLAAYSVARLTKAHLAPAARVVFGWALLERLTKRIRPGVKLRHVDVRDFVLQVCEASARNDARAPVSWSRLKAVVERAYELRNGLAHGEPEAVENLDFPALARAATLLARRLSVASHGGP
jgi:hypothetical protein